MCIVKTNIGHEKRNVCNTFTVNSLSLALLFITITNKNPKIDHKIAANKFIQVIWQFPECVLMSIHYIFVEYSVCFHLFISSV